MAFFAKLIAKIILVHPECLIDTEHYFRCGCSFTDYRVEGSVWDALRRRTMSKKRVAITRLSYDGAKCNPSHQD